MSDTIESTYCLYYFIWYFLGCLLTERKVEVFNKLWFNKKKSNYYSLTVRKRSKMKQSKTKSLIFFFFLLISTPTLNYFADLMMNIWTNVFESESTILDVRKNRLQKKPPKNLNMRAGAIRTLTYKGFEAFLRCQLKKPHSVSAKWLIWVCSVKITKTVIKWELKKKVKQCLFS